MCWQQTTVGKPQSQDKYEDNAHDDDDAYDCDAYDGDTYDDEAHDDNDKVYDDDGWQFWSEVIFSSSAKWSLFRVKVRPVIRGEGSTVEVMVCLENFALQLYCLSSAIYYVISVSQTLLNIIVKTAHILCLAVIKESRPYITQSLQFPDGILFPDTISINLTLTIDPLARFIYPNTSLYTIRYVKDIKQYSKREK